jgi:hypothetical protein
MALTTESPRFSLRSAKLAEIDAAISEIGHAVIDDVWNPSFLSTVHALARKKYEDDDRRYLGHFSDYPKAVIDVYLGSCNYLESVSNGQDLREIYFSELDRSGLPALLRELLKGDFFVDESERVIRRTDPRFPLRFIGLHKDGQVGPCSRAGINSKRELTIWTPLQDCTDDDTPRLLLLHRGDDIYDLMSADELAPVVLHADVQKFETSSGSLADGAFDRIYEARRCYAPKVPLGSCIIFEHDIVHGAFRTSKMQTPRYSLDFRIVGRYRPTLANGTYKGILYRSADFPNNEVLRFASRVVRKLKQMAAS